jgi:hypothetical protein
MQKPEAEKVAREAQENKLQALWKIHSPQSDDTTSAEA